MNKKLLFLSAAIIFSLSMFFSCGLKINIDETINDKYRPDVKESDTKGAIITTKLYTDNTTEITLYRRTLNDKKKKTYTDPVIIGILYPQNISTSNKTYTFEDPSVIQNNTYSYKIRYYDSKNYEYSYSNWSDDITFAEDSPKAQNDSFVYKYTLYEDSYFLYDSDSKSLKLKNDNSDYSSTSPLIQTYPQSLKDTEIIPTLIFQNLDTSKKLAVKLSSSEKDLDTELHLLEYLPDSWWNTKLKLVGLVGVQEKSKLAETDDGNTKIIEYIYFTETTEGIETKEYINSELEDITSITINTSGSGTSYDFSPVK